MKLHSPWRTFLGHCPVVTAYLAAHPYTSSPACFLAHAANTFLRAVGQPAFVDNPLLGLLILLAIFLPHPQVGLGCLLGGGLATLTELVMGLHPWALVSNGVAAFNGVLVGTVIPILFPLFYGEAHNPAGMWVAVAVGAVTTVFLASAFNSFLAKFNLPYMALPFNLVAVVVFLTLQPVGLEHMVVEDSGESVDNATLTILEGEGAEFANHSHAADHAHHMGLTMLGEEQISWAGVGRGIVVSMGQVYAVNHVAASLVVHLAVLLSSPLLFLLSNLGAVLGTLTSLTFLPPEDYQQVYDGIWGYNALLAMAAASCVFFPLSPASLAAGATGTLATVAVQAALRRNMDTNHLPVFTLPMTLVTLVILLAASDRPALCRGPPLARCATMSFPEQQAMEAWQGREGKEGREDREEEQGNQEEKEPAILKQV